MEANSCENDINVESKFLKEGLSCNNLEKGNGEKQEKIDLEVFLFPWLLWHLDLKVFKDEFKWKNLWTSKKWKSIAKGFVLGFLNLLPSISDLITDYLSAHTFIKGTNYIKNVENISDFSLSSHNCTLIGESYSSYYDFTGKEINSSMRHFRFSCFEQDPFWGSLTLCFTHAPGFFIIGPLLFNLMHIFRPKMKFFLSIGILFLVPTLIILFPLIRTIIMIITLLNRGQEWDKISAWTKGTI